MYNSIYNSIYNSMSNSFYVSSSLVMDSLKYFTYSETRRAFPLGFPLLQNSSAYRKHF